MKRRKRMERVRTRVLHVKGGDPQQPVVTQETHKPLGMLPVYHRWADWCSLYQPTQWPLSWSSDSGHPPLPSLKRLQPSFTHSCSTSPLLICLGSVVPIYCILDSISGIKNGAELSSIWSEIPKAKRQLVEEQWTKGQNKNQLLNPSIGSGVTSVSCQHLQFLVIFGECGSLVVLDRSVLGTSLRCK
jgi:hypothetical protein